MGMLELNAILDIVTLILLALGGYALVLLKAGTEAAVKTSAEEAAKATIQQLQWPAELARELQKTRASKDKSSASRAMERSGKNFDRLRFTMRRSSTER